MYIVMRAHKVADMKRRKMESSLVASLIRDYMAATSSASSQRLASFLGIKRDVNLVSQAIQDHEFDRRTSSLYLEIFPEHEGCTNLQACTGHRLPELPSLVLEEMGFPSDMKALASAVGAWFTRIDEDGSGRVNQAELFNEFHRIGISEDEAFCIWKHHGADKHGSLDVGQFKSMIVHLIENSHATLSTADLLALAPLVRQYDEDKSGSLDLKEFTKLAKELIDVYIFNGRESIETLEVQCPQP